MPDVPFRPTTPPAQPPPPVPPPAPAPAVPASPPPTPPPTTPPTQPPKQTPPPPPAATPAPTPAPQPPASPAAAPIPKNPHPHHILTGLFVLLCALGVIGVLLLIFLPKLQGMIPQTAPPTVETNVPAPVATSTQTTAPTATTTPPLASGGATSTYQEPAPTIHRLGETVRLFADDSAIFKNGAGTAFNIKVQQFTDSRCAKGNTCIWEGERGVILLVTDTATNQTATVSLGMVRARTAKAFGLTFTLKEVDDEKGGTYADITVR